MTAHPLRFGLALTAVVGIGAPLAITSQANAETYRSSGKTSGVDLSWIEYDLDNLLGLPGNVHVGYLYAYSGQWGNWVGGSVADFDCDEGEVPWGGHHAAAVVDEGLDTAEVAIGDAIDAIIDSGASAIDPALVAAEVEAQLAEAVPEEVEDDFEEIPICDFVQTRFLDGSKTATITVDLKLKRARVTGSVIVHGGHGEDGEPGPILAQPPVDITIVGGDWNRWTSTYSSRGAGYSYNGNEQGMSYYGGTVTGRIGGMLFDDDADDESFAGFSLSSYQSVERVR